jgi:large subunit ribosomal protein L25
MNDFSLKLDKRVAEGKKVKKLRHAGYVPSVVYGGHSDPLSMQSIYNETEKIVSEVGKHTPLSIVIDDKKKLAIIKDIDFDPVTHKIRHIAFHTIKQNDKITTEVPIELIDMGESPAERAGLVILQAIEHIEIKAKPADLPESLQVSVKVLASDEDKILISDLQLPSGVEYADKEQDLELVVANVYEPGALQAANEAAGGDTEADDVNEAVSETAAAPSAAPAENTESK